MPVGVFQARKCAVFVGAVRCALHGSVEDFRLSGLWTYVVNRLGGCALPPCRRCSPFERALRWGGGADEMFYRLWERHRAPTKGAPTGSFGGVVKLTHEGGEGRHKACPYGTVSGVW